MGQALVLRLTILLATATRGVDGLIYRVDDFGHRLFKGEGRRRAGAAVTNALEVEIVGGPPVIEGGKQHGRGVVDGRIDHSVIGERITSGSGYGGSGYDGDGSGYDGGEHERCEAVAPGFTRVK